MSSRQATCAFFAREETLQRLMFDYDCEDLELYLLMEEQESPNQVKAVSFRRVVVALGGCGRSLEESCALIYAFCLCLKQNRTQLAVARVGFDSDMAAPVRQYEYRWCPQRDLEFI